MHENDKQFGLWAMVAIVPLITVFFSFILGPWSWGLMDDYTILVSGNGILERFWHYFTGLGQWGVFRPTFALHSALFYGIFENTPRFFYIFRLLEISALLMIWGACAYRITRKKIALVLLPAITLSFHYFYDGFFYLSSQEAIGLFFLGLAVWLFSDHIEPILKADTYQRVGRLDWKKWLAGVFMLLCALGAKETFISCAMAIGTAYLYLAWALRRNSLARAVFFYALGLIAVAVLWAALILIFIKSNYTSGYSVTDMTKLGSNFQAWFRKDFFNHSPWLIAAVWVLFVTDKSGNFLNAMRGIPMRLKWGIALGILLYGGFLLILLPWNTLSYYAAPLGLLWAFLITMLISEAVSRAGASLQIALIVGALFMNQFICQYALAREATYQYDTANLMTWLKTNESFVNDERPDLVATNAMEPAAAIPGLMNRIRGTHLKPFKWATDSAQISQGPQNYYLYSPRFYGVDLSKLKQWEIVFLSKNWVMYKR